MLRSFREYLCREYKNQPEGQRLDEAKYGQAPRKSYQFDAEDIDFLKQFNHSLWAQAHHQRMELLFDKLEKSRKVHEELGLQKLKTGLARYFKDRTEENKRFIKELDAPFDMTEDELEKIGSAMFTAGMTDEDIDHAAENAAITHYNAKKKEFPVIDDPEYHEFKFKNDIFVPVEGELPIRTGGKRTKDEIVVRARPYLLRLYHKLETHPSERYPHASNLDGFGKYGFDLGGPLRGEHGEPHATRGMRFPTYANVSGSMKRYFELLAHRMFGDFDDSVTWMDSGLGDTFVRDEALESIIKSISSSGMFNNIQSENEKREKIVNEAKKQLIDGIRKKTISLKTPPYPGTCYPNGYEITENDIIRTRKGQRKSGEATEDIKAPPLYLPYKRVNNKWVLEAKPGHFYKKIEHGDMVDPSKIRGHRKDYVKADDIDDPTGKAIQKDAGIFINHNTPELAKLVRGTKEYREAEQAILNNQPRGSFSVYNGEAEAREDQNGEYIYPILQGVIKCINNPGCGGKTTHEINIMTKYIPAIYQYAYKYIEDNLDREDFYEYDRMTGDDGQEQTIRKLKGQGERRARQRVNPLFAAVRNMAEKATNLVSQKGFTAEGGGKRQRAKSSTERQKRVENPLYQYRIQFIGPIMQPHGFAINFPYNIDNFRKYLGDLQKFQDQANKVEEESQKVQKAAKDAIAKRQDTVTTKETLKNMILKAQGMESALREDYIMWLTSLIRSGNRDMPQEEAEKNAKRIVDEWEKENLSPKQMANAFLSHPLVEKFTSEIKQKAQASGTAISRPQVSLPNALIQKEINDAIEVLDGEIASRGGDSNHPAIRAKFFTPAQGKKYSNYVNQIGSELATDQQFSDDPETLDAVLDKIGRAHV